MLKGEKIRALIPPLAGVLRLARLVTAGLQSLPHHCWWFPSRVGSRPETKCALANTCVRMRTDCIVGSAVAPPMTSAKGQVGQVSFKKNTKLLIPTWKIQTGWGWWASSSGQRGPVLPGQQLVVVELNVIESVNWAWLTEVNQPLVPWLGASGRLPCLGCPSLLGLPAVQTNLGCYSFKQAPG